MQRNKTIHFTPVIVSFFGSALLLLMVCTSVSTHAQVLPKPEKKEDSQEKNENRDPSLRFVDEDGDGLRDQATLKRGRRGEAVDQRKQRRRRRDQFIDLDGDGINDNRCSGVGIMRGQRHGKAQFEER